MKFKMRVMHFSPAGNTQKLSQEIARAQQTTSDQIPPSYPCENEKLLFIGVEMKGSSVDKVVTDLCKDLSTDRAKNVAFFAVGSGSFDAVKELQQLVTAKGINVVGDTFACTVKGGLFKKGTVTDADVKGAVDWAAKIVDSL